MDSTRLIDSEATVRPVRDEGEFCHLMRTAIASDDKDGARDGLLDLLEMNGLRGNMVRRAIAALRSEMDFDDGMTRRRQKRILRICLRLIALHNTSMHFCECTVADISSCLHVVVSLGDYGRGYVELIDDEYALPFIFDAVKTTRDKDNRDDVSQLACELFFMMPKSLRVTLVVRYYTLLPDIFMACFGEEGKEEEHNYYYLKKPEYAGIVATSPSLLVKLLSAVNDHDAPDTAVNYDVVDDQSCAVLESLLANTLTRSRVLLQDVLGSGVLNAVVSFYARPSRHRGRHRRHVKTAATIRAVLAAYPVWTQTVRRIAETATEVNAVIVLGKALPPRRAAGGILYELL